MNNRGSVLLPILIVGLVFSATLAAQYRESRREMMISQNLLHQQQLFYYAEAGLVFGLGQLQQDSEWEPCSSGCSLPGPGGFILERQEGNGNRFLISRGYLDSEEFFLTASFSLTSIETGDGIEQEVGLDWWREGLPDMSTTTTY